MLVKKITLFLITQIQVTKSPSRFSSLLPFSSSRDSLSSIKPKRSQTNSPVRRTIFESEVAEDSSAAEDNIDEKPKKFIEYGFVQLYLQYVDSKLVVKVLEGKHLINTDSSSANDKSDAYARVLLLPDRKKRTKRRTKVVKNSQEPKWDEQFEYNDLSLDDVKARTLDILIKNDHFIISREKTFMGKCMIPLDQVVDLENGNTNWYKLQCKHFFEQQEKKLSE
jgi:hypothetical protein